MKNWQYPALVSFIFIAPYVGALAGIGLSILFMVFAVIDSKEGE